MASPRAKKDIRRASLDDLRRMHERGETAPTPPDAPTVELDERFWRNAALRAYYEANRRQ